MENNSVQYVRVISQKGGSFTITNPWPGQTLVEYKNGASAGTVSGTKITIATSANDTIHFAPNGTSYATIIAQMALSLGNTTGGSGTGPSFFPDANYGGTGVTLGVGSYTLAQLQAAGIANDSVSSLKVPAGYQIVGYLDDGFSGTPWTFTANNADLATTGNDNAISSLVVSQTGSGVVSFRSHADNKYVTAENGGASALIADGAAIGQLQQFDLIHNSDGSVSLRSHANNQYVTAENAGASALIANRTAIGQWEEFDLINN
jgi:hypothetical protein